MAYNTHTHRDTHWHTCRHLPTLNGNVKLLNGNGFGSSRVVFGILNRKFQLDCVTTNILPI